MKIRKISENGNNNDSPSTKIQMGFTELNLITGGQTGGSSLSVLDCLGIFHGTCNGFDGTCNHFTGDCNDYEGTCSSRN